jgi:hypothetical protein
MKKSGKSGLSAKKKKKKKYLRGEFRISGHDKLEATPTRLHFWAY